MNGGGRAQLGFNYQNSYSILKILEGLESSSSITKAYVEQKLDDESNEEIDLILVFADGLLESYEIKSGYEFTDSKADICDSIRKLYIKCKENLNSRAYLVISPNHSSVMSQVIADLRVIQENRRNRQSKLTEYMQCASITTLERNDFEEFIRNNLKVVVSDFLEAKTIYVLCLNRIKQIQEKIVANCDEGLKLEDIYNRLKEILIQSIGSRNGEINLVEFYESIIDAVARNKVIATNRRRVTILDLQREKNNVSLKLRSIFPAMPVLPPEASLDET